MRKSILAPFAVSSLRIAGLPLFFFLYNTGNITPCLILFAVLAFTDLFDGYLARKRGVPSRFGAYYDAATDFAMVIGIFAFFSLKGLYPVWLLALIAASFLQFLISSIYAKRLYDPIGRYTGSALYIGVALTLVVPSQATFSFVEYAFLGWFLLSLGSRAVSLARNRA